MPLNSKIDVYCREPVNGRYVTITRQRIAKFRPDMIVLAEIKIFEKKNSHPEAIPSSKFTLQFYFTINRYFTVYNISIKRFKMFKI